MPPKRKRAGEATADEEASTSARTTRRSTRQSAKTTAPEESPPESSATSSKKVPVKKAAGKAPPKPKASKAKLAAKDEGDQDDDEDEEPPAKKPRTKVTRSKPKTTATKGSRGKKAATEAKEAASNSIPDDEEAEASKSKSASKVAPAPTTAKPPPPPIPRTEPYSSARATQLFNQFADEDEPDVIGPEGFEKICTEAQIAVDGALPMILSWQLNAKEMMKIKREEWEKGTSTLKVSSLLQFQILVSDLENLLILGEAPLKNAPKKRDDEPFDRTLYWRYAANKKAAFNELYTYCFNLAKPEQSRNIDMETSVAFWTVLLTRQYPIMNDVLEFITESGSYKATNKDLWGMMLEFCETVDPTLQNYEADGAWPTLLDDFVEWKKGKQGKEENDAPAPSES